MSYSMEEPYTHSQALLYHANTCFEVFFALPEKQTLEEYNISVPLVLSEG